MPKLTVAEIKQKFPEESALIDDANLRINMVLQTMLNKLNERNQEVDMLRRREMDLVAETHALRTRADFLNQQLCNASKKKGARNGKPTRHKGR
jgi:hypothetical protein